MKTPSESRKRGATPRMGAMKRSYVRRIALLGAGFSYSGFDRLTVILEIPRKAFELSSEIVYDLFRNESPEHLRALDRVFFSCKDAYLIPSRRADVWSLACVLKTHYRGRLRDFARSVVLLDRELAKRGLRLRVRRSSTRYPDFMVPRVKRRLCLSRRVAVARIR